MPSLLNQNQSDFACHSLAPISRTYARIAPLSLSLCIVAKFGYYFYPCSAFCSRSVAFPFSFVFKLNALAKLNFSVNTTFAPASSSIALLYILCTFASLLYTYYKSPRTKSNARTLVISDWLVNSIRVGLFSSLLALLLAAFAQLGAIFILFCVHHQALIRANELEDQRSP